MVCVCQIEADYRHSTLADDLHGETLKQGLTDVLSTFSEKCEQIAPFGSTKENE